MAIKSLRLETTDLIAVANLPHRHADDGGGHHVVALQGTAEGGDARVPGGYALPHVLERPPGVDLLLRRHQGLREVHLRRQVVLPGSLTHLSSDAAQYCYQVCKLNPDKIAKL